MFQNDFTVTLPSNSSMKHYPDNTTTNYSTYLPKEIDLIGKWEVGLSEIHVPCNVLHVSKEDALINEPGLKKCYFQYGVYDSVETLVKAINDAWKVNYGAEFHKKLFYDRKKGGYVQIGFQPLTQPWEHDVLFSAPCLSDCVKRILGVDTSLVYVIDGIPSIGDYNIFNQGQHPASLARAIPDQLYVYSNICEPNIVGDTYAPLLRIVNIEAKNFNFGCTTVKRFNPVSYVPLLNNRFHTIDIDIRDQFGKSIAFEFGTLTVVLHFRRVD